MKEFSITIDDYCIYFKVVHDEFHNDSRYLAIKRKLGSNASLEYILLDTCNSIQQIIDKLI